MTKASGPKTRPEVARNNANRAAGIYDFVQSPEWQKVLEKARVEQERNSAAGAEAKPQTKQAQTGQAEAGESTTGEQSPSTQKAWSDQLEEAKRLRNTEQPGLDAESGHTGTNPSDDVQNHVTDPEIDPEFSLRLSNEEIDYRLSKKLLQKLEEQRQTRRRVRFGLVAIGCLFGVVASSSVFLVSLGLRPSEPEQSAAATNTGSEYTDIGLLAGDRPTQPDPSPREITSIAQGDIVIASDLFNTQPEPAVPDSNLVEPEDLDSLAALAPLPSDSDAEAIAPEPPASELAPNVLAYVPALEKPLFPVGGSGYLPRQEANPSFLPYDVAPEFFVTVVALTDVATTRFEPIEMTQDAFAVPVRTPEIAVLPVSFKVPPGLPPVEQPVSVLPPIPSETPDLPLSTKRTENDPVTVALGPSSQEAYPALGADVMQAPVFTPRSSPVAAPEVALVPSEAIPTPTETVAPATNIRVRLYAPNRLSTDAVESIAADLATSGHELGGTARVGYKVSQSNVRFYHQQDAARAAVLAEDAGALLRDFTGSNSKTPTGVVELYLAGEGFSTAPAKRTVKRSNRNTTTSSQTSQLRSQVLKKLRATTN